MRIGELAAATGVGAETIRFYERKGLLPGPARAPNGYRAYAPTHVKRLAFIRHCRALDVPLADVRRLLEFSDRPHQDCGSINHVIDEHLARIHARLEAIRSVERQLVQLRKQCAAGRRAARCGILKTLRSPIRQKYAR